MIIKSPERPAAMLCGVSAKGARTNGGTIVEKALSPYIKIPKPETTICDSAMERSSRRGGLELCAINSSCAQEGVAKQALRQRYPIEPRTLLSEGRASQQD